MFPPRLVMMEGVPGSGKSALAENLVKWARESGVEVDHLPEEAIFTRPEFADVGHAFTSKEFPTPELMMAAYERVFDAAQMQGATVIADWSAVSMIEDLPCAQPDRATVTSDTPSAVADIHVLTGHARDVMRACGGRAVLIVLEVSLDRAIQRAAAQRGPEWIERQIARWPNDSTTPRTVGEVARGYQAYETRRRAIVFAHEEAGWEVQRLNASVNQREMLREAVQRTFPYV